jgi:hypothetical protein
MRCGVAARGRGSAGSDDDQETGSSGLLRSGELEWDDRGDRLTWSVARDLYGTRWANALAAVGMLSLPEGRPEGWVDVSPRFVAGPPRWGGEWCMG